MAMTLKAAFTNAEKLLAAEKEGERIAVEVKSFLDPSPVEDLKTAVGQFILYHDILAHKDPERKLYLAIREEVFAAIFSEPIGTILLENHRVQLVVFDPKAEVILQWIP